MELDPATAAYRKHGYNDRPVEARLGPHRFRIPANYFRDQIGPDFQGNFSLLVQWPDLEPLPPGKRSGQDMATFDRQITITPYYVDQVPIETLLERRTMPLADPDQIEAQDPRDRLDLMRALPKRDGLVPYVVDMQKLEDYARRYQESVGVAPGIGRETYKDWFVRHDSDGKLLTLIRCDLEPEPGSYLHPQCTHDLTMPEWHVSVRIDYRREHLPDWRRIEERARELLARYRVEK